MPYSALMVEVVGVNVGFPRPLGQVRGATVHSGIAKQPVIPGTVLWLSLANLAGDGQADLSVHGGPDKAVYAYPSEHLAGWEAELGAPLGPAAFGENLSTRSVTEEQVLIGDRWAWDDAVLEVCQPRWPCFKLALHRGRPDIQNRMKANGRTGWYLRVLQPGEVTVGSPISVIKRDPSGVSVRDAHLAMADRHLGDPGRVQAVAGHARLAARWRQPLEERLAAC